VDCHFWRRTCRFAERCLYGGLLASEPAGRRNSCPSINHQHAFYEPGTYFGRGTIERIIFASVLNLITPLQGCHRINEEYVMIRKIIVVLPLFIVTGCGLGHALQEAGTENERYRTCVLHQIETYSAHNSGPALTVEETTEFVISACRREEEAYVAAMTNLAMTITGHMVSQEKFLADKEATLRGDLRDFAASLVEEEL
jgi:hypothetical protein